MDREEPGNQPLSGYSVSDRHLNTEPPDMKHTTFGASLPSVSSPVHPLIRRYIVVFPPEGVVGQTQAWMPVYASILRIPQMVSVWRATVE
jgi:hypothetical protein